MNQKEYTLSNKDKKFLSAILFLHFGGVMLTVSLFGLYYHNETEDCRKVAETVKLAEWATEQVNKSKAEQKIESIKQSYKNQGISAEEY